MNTRSDSCTENHETDLKPELQRQAEFWLKLLDRCALKPCSKRVHALRSGTLRLESQLAWGLRDRDAGDDCVLAFTKWKKQARKLRRALRPVREVDVSRQRCAGLRAALATSDGSSLDERDLGLRRRFDAIDALVGRLKSRRDKAGSELVLCLAERRKRLRRLIRQITPALDAFDSVPAQEALRLFAELCDEFPRLEAENLHEFRKRLRQIVYLAEIPGSVDPEGRRLAAAFRKMVDAIGDWHDWEQMAKLARRMLCDSQEGEDGITSLLESLTEEAFRKAIGLSRRTALRLLRKGGRAVPAGLRERFLVGQPHAQARD